MNGLGIEILDERRQIDRQRRDRQTERQTDRHAHLGYVKGFI